MLILQADDGGRVVLHRHGAHVTSWITPDGREQLYLSPLAAMDGRSAIRGGVPVIFPQFAGEGPLPKHGFARTSEWTLASIVPDGPTPHAVMELRDSAATRTVWPHRFIAALRVELVNGVLQLSLGVQNTGKEPLHFTAALHTYLRVDDAFATRLRGLRGVRFRDSTAGGAVKTQDEAELACTGEVNRIYLEVPGAVDVVDGPRMIRSSMHGFTDVVVWNPGRGGEAALGDMEPGGSAQMLCVEAAVIGAPVVLAPGSAWSGVQRLTVTAEP